MPLLLPPMELPPVSETGRALQERALEIHRHSSRSEYLAPVTRPELVKELWRVFQENSHPDWDGHGAAPASVGSHRSACKLIARLPPSLSDPEVGMDPDGEFSLEWFGTGRDHGLSISIGGDERLAFAFRNGVERRKGITILRGQLPPELLAYMQSFASR